MDVSQGAAFAVWDAGDGPDSFLFVRPGRVRSLSRCKAIRGHLFAFAIIQLHSTAQNKTETETY